jgi:hypothetical protein
MMVRPIVQLPDLSINRNESSGKSRVRNRPNDAELYLKVGDGMKG